MLALLAALLFLIAAITGENGSDFLTLAAGTWLALGLVALAVQIALADAYLARRIRRTPPQ